MPSARTKKIDGVSLAPVDDYPEVTDEPRTLEDTIAAEGRFTPDQITDYHKDNPTLDTSGPAYDPEVREALVNQSLKPFVAAAREVAKEIEAEEA